MPVRLLLMLAAACVLSLPVSAQDADSQDRVQQLERENDQLRQELARLRLELSRVKKQLSELQANGQEPAPDQADQQDQAQAQDQDESAATTEAESPSKPDDAPEDKEEPVRTYRSADEIHRAIPERLQPARDGWSVTGKKYAWDWLHEQIPGSRFEARKTVSSYTIAADPLNRDIWYITVHFEPQTMRYMNWGMQEIISPLRLVADAEMVDNAPRRFRKGSRIRVLGSIRSVSWNYAQLSPNEDWHPKTCTIALEDVELK